MSLLPPYKENTNTTDRAKDRNVLEVLINSNNQLMVEYQPLLLHELSAITQKHLTNYGKLSNFSESPQKAIISLKSSAGTSYQTYIQVLNELKAAYRNVRNQYAQQHYKQTFTDLSKKQKKEVRANFPMFISEAEPDPGEQ